MAAVTWAMIESLDAEFSKVAIGRQQDIVDLVNELSSVGLGGEDDARYKMARIYLGAHNAKLFVSDVAGLVTQEVVAADQISTSYAVARGLDRLDRTPWGELYSSLMEGSLSRVPKTWGPKSIPRCP